MPQFSNAPRTTQAMTSSSTRNGREEPSPRRGGCDLGGAGGTAPQIAYNTSAGDPSRLRFSHRRVVLALAIGGLLFTSIACDSMESDASKADRLIKESVNDSAGKRGPTTQALNNVIADLNKAANQSGASLTGKIEAKSLLAQAEV